MYIHTVEYYSVIKKNKVLTSAAWISLESITLRERSQTQKITYCTILFRKTHRIGKSIKTECRLTVARDTEGGIGENSPVKNLLNT